MISALKTELVAKLKELLPSLADAIFNDDAGDVWNWAVTGGSHEVCTHKNAREALRALGAAIVVCSPSQRKTLDAVPYAAVREARFPIIVLSGPIKKDAPNHDDLVTEVERVVLSVQHSCFKQRFILGEGARFEVPNSSVVFAHCQYKINLKNV